MPIQPIELSRPADHVLGAGAQFVHPGNGNAYAAVCLKWHGVNQDLLILRRKPPYDMSIPPEVVHVYDGGGEDSDYQITMGSCVILPTGALWTLFSAVPKGDTPEGSDTGFMAQEDIIPGIDDPYSSTERLVEWAKTIERMVGRLQLTLLETGKVLAKVLE